MPTHLDGICSDSSHVPSLSARLPASGLPTLPLIILSQLFTTSFPSYGPTSRDTHPLDPTFPLAKT